jgi:glutamate carboxypeptidase
MLRAVQSPAPGSAQARIERRLKNRIRRDRIRMIRLLSGLVRQNSGSDNGPGIGHILNRLEAELAPLGFIFQHVARDVRGGPHLVARREGKGRRVLLVGHADTIFEPEHRFQSFQIEGTLAKGPGVKDMKGGLVVLCRALRALHKEGQLAGHPVTVLFNGDEETGSLSSRELIQKLAPEASLGLVYEGGSNGVLTTSRGGLGQGHFEIEGVPAHIASRVFTADANQELAEKLLRILRLNDPGRGIHVNVAPIQGGIKRNQVSGKATGSIDLRFRRAEDGERLLREVKQILSTSYVTNPAYNLRTRTTFDVFLHRPPFAETAEIRALADLFIGVGADLGLGLRTGSSAGGSDQNLVVAAGVPCLDSLGMRGKGAHTVEEQGEIDSLVPRTQLTALALLRLWINDETAR